VRRAAKQDANSTAIVEEARRLGMFVLYIGQPVDLLAYFAGEWALIEIKNPKGKNRYTKAQLEFLELCKERKAPVITWRYVQDCRDFVHLRMLECH
jgi:hypothetical protein